MLKNLSPDQYFSCIISKWPFLNEEDKLEIKSKLMYRFGNTYLKQINFLIALNKILFK